MVVWGELGNTAAGILRKGIILVYGGVTGAILFGAIIGSFLNVCIHRLPLRESLLWPRSRCPQCAKTIAWYDNLPILSYLWLRGRCRACRRRISWRYPLVEALNAAGYGLIIWRFGFSASTLVYLLLWSSLIVVSFIDLDHMIIPDRITLPGIALGLVAGTLLLPRWWDSVVGLLVGGGILYFMAWISPYLFGKEGMGGGDIKLLAMIGAFLGWKPAILTIFFGGLLGAVVGVTLMGVRVITREAYLPFGPFLSLGAVVVILYGQEILAWYGSLLGGGG
jgi:leader peptidase (prepilin peptidase)/N-methyltransferase